MRGFFRDFQLFIARGNVSDLAVAVVLGGAFGSITTSLVDDVIMPPIGYLIGGVDFQDLVLRLNSEVVSPLRRVLKHYDQLFNRRAGNVYGRAARHRRTKLSASRGCR